MPTTAGERPANYILLCTNLSQDITEEMLVMLFQQFVFHLRPLLGGLLLGDLI